MDSVFSFVFIALLLLYALFMVFAGLLLVIYSFSNHTKQ